MKKKSIIALILAASLSLGVATATGCNVINPNGPGGNSTENEGGGSTAVTGVTLSDSEITLNISGSKKLTATVSPSNATNKGVVWSSDNKAVATVDQNGNVTAVAKGTAVITVTTSDGNYAATCTVTVTDTPSGDKTVSVTKVTLDNSSATITAGETKTLTATIAPSTATNKNLTWSSNKPSIATVDQNGKITAVANGTAIITVTTEDGGHKATCTVTVEGTTQNTPVTGISIGSATAALDLNGQKTKQFTATVTPSGATNKTVTWASSNSSVVTVDQNGLATAKATGTATITATANDGSGVKGSCAVTVTDSTVVPKTKYTVDFYSDGVKVTSQEVEEGKCATIPTDVKKDGYYISGWGTSSATGANYDFTSKVTGNLSLHAKWEKVAEGLAYSYAGNECAAFEWGDSNPAQATVKYKISGGSYVEVDEELIRSSATAGNARVDIVGLKGGANYDFEITSSTGKKINVSNMQISAYDRSGYAHFNYTSGVGAYNDDGTPKSNANIVYVTEANKNSDFVVGGKTYSGIVNVLKNAGKSTPLIVRVIGTVGAATWNSYTYTKTSSNTDSKNNLLPEAIKGKNGKQLPQSSSSLTQAALISGGYNTLNTDTYSELLNLDSKAKWDSDKSEYDSCWNDCSISGASNVTVEGIGEDARIFQWGLTFKSCNSIEVRNLTFEDYTEDACSFEGSKTSASKLSDFIHKNFWIHHNTFKQGINYWDICKEQDKHEGDGATDFKGLSNVTIAYNVYHDNHKTGLIGGSNSQTTANVTFHHNYYNHNSSRLPLARQANMHMYNNYYYNTTGTNMSLRAGAYAFIENCYFDNANNPIVIEERDSTYGIGAAKLLGNVFSGKNPANNDYLYYATSRTQTVTTENRFSKTFDTDSSVFYYKNGVSDVTNMLTAEQVKTEVPKLAGVQKHTGTAGSGGSSGGGDEHQHTYSDTYTSAGASGHYKMANCEHTTEHTTLEAHVYDNATDTTCNECGYVRTIGGETGEAITTTKPAGTISGNISEFSDVSGKTTATVSAGDLSIYISDLSFERVTSDNKTMSLTGSKEFKFESGVTMTVTAKSSDVYLVLNMSTRSASMTVTAGSDDPVTLDLSTDKTIYIRLTQGTTYVITRVSGNNDLVSINVLLPN